jgi:DNA-binding transcriptional regulator YiaG
MGRVMTERHDRMRKRCPSCGIVKDRGEFYRRTWNDERRGKVTVRTSTYCKQCEREMVSAKSRARYRLDAEYRAKRLASSAKSRLERRRENEESRRWMSESAKRHIAILREHGYSTAAIARAAGVTSDAVRDWERGKYAPKRSSLAALRHVCGTLKQQPDRGSQCKRRSRSTPTDTSIPKVSPCGRS